jgi:uncharacterized membrane protein
MKRFSNWILAGVVCVLIHPSALACATCFGNSDSPMAKGMNAGIAVLLGVVGLLWLAFASFFVFIVQRSRQGGEPLPGEQNDPQHN